MKRTHSFVFMLTLVTVGFAAAAQTTPFKGVVTGDDVYVRSGPSQTYYDVAKVNTGDMLDVVDLMHSWYVVKAPAGTFSYIAKQYVEVAADGKTGTVTGNRVRVRAPSKAGPTIEQSYKSQLKLDRGAKVEVIGEAGLFYKIVPPEGAMAYVHSDYIRQATPGEIAAATQGTTTATETATDTTTTAVDTATGTTGTEAVTVGDAPPAGDGNTVTSVGTSGDTTDTTTITDTTTTDTTTTADTTETTTTTETTDTTDTTATTATTETTATVDAGARRTADEQLATLEAKFAEASNQPLGKQPVEELLIDYKALKMAGGLDEQSMVLVDTRIELLEARADLQETLVELEHAREQAAATKPMMTTYDAVGRLIASTLYTGDRLPLLYRLVDPLTGLTIGYVEPEKNLDLNPLLGRVVGVKGKTRFHPGLKLKVITVSQADALTAVQ